MKIGDKVYYNNRHGRFANGIIKYIEDDRIFVVYYCGEDWENYKNYTGQLTDQQYLGEGWVDKNGNPLTEQQSPAL